MIKEYRIKRFPGEKVSFTKFFSKYQKRAWHV